MNAELEGYTQLLRQLDNLDERGYNKVVKKGLTKYVGKIAQTAKKLIPVRSGAAKKGLSYVAAAKRRGSAVGYIGAKTSVAYDYVRPPMPGTPFMSNAVILRKVPWKYLRLANFGHGGRYPAKPLLFMERAVSLAENAASFAFVTAADKELERLTR